MISIIRKITNDMKFYKNSYTDKRTGYHAGNEWFGSHAEADRVWVLRHRRGEVVDGNYSVRALRVTIDTRKAGLVKALNDWAAYPYYEYQDAAPFIPGEDQHD